MRAIVAVGAKLMDMLATSALSREDVFCGLQVACGMLMEGPPAMTEPEVERLMETVVQINSGLRQIQPN